MNDIDKQQLNNALKAITSALNTIQSLRDDLTDEDEEKLGSFFGAIEDHGTQAEQAGERLWAEVSK